MTLSAAGRACRAGAGAPRWRNCQCRDRRRTADRLGATPSSSLREVSRRWLEAERSSSAIARGLDAYRDQLDVVGRPTRAPAARTRQRSSRAHRQLTDLSRSPNWPIVVTRGTFGAALRLRVVPDPRPWHSDNAESVFDGRNPHKWSPPHKISRYLRTQFSLCPALVALRAERSQRVGNEATSVCSRKNWTGQGRKQRPRDESPLLSRGRWRSASTTLDHHG